MKKIARHLLIALCLLQSALLSAQNPSRVTIKGNVIDTTQEQIAFATVMLLNPKDTTLVNFTRSDDKGQFSFRNVKNTPYLLKISYVGYLPYQQHLPVSPAETNDLGVLKIKPISNELMEVVIKTAKAPLRIRGDTIEYDASTFKVPPGSTVEDLLRRLPGIEVDEDGNIKAQGKDVKKVYVDGKTFFGDDPKSATKNLGAETISKVQVYNEKSEQAKLTGVDDGKKEKALNLELKEEYKKGSFGKVSVAAGTSDRWAGRGNYNRFNPKQQLSFIGYANNINQTGVNWEDYGEFKGQNTFNDNDNGDFGFGGRGGRFYYIGGDDDSPLNNFDGRGFTENYGAGTNYNFDNTKTKLNTSYFYNQTALDLDQYGFRQTFLGDNSFSNADTSAQNNFRSNHSVIGRIEHNIDSSDALIVKANLRFGLSDNNEQQSSLFTQNDNQLLNRLSFDNGSEMNSIRLSSSAIFRHRFKKKGRSFAASAGYNDSRSDGTENLFSINRLFSAGSFTEQIRQMNDRANNTQQLKSSLLYTEPLSKKWFWESFYNFSQTNNDLNRQTADPERSNARIDSLSVFYDNKVLYNRLGSSMRYSNAGLNVSVGVAVQQIRLDGSYARDKGLPPLEQPLSRTFNNWTPNVDLSYQLPNNQWINLGYSYSISEPQFNDLQPAPNVNNPAFRTIGNPLLTPERAHNINLNYNYWNPASFANIGFGGSMGFMENQIVYNQINEFINGRPVTTSTPVNVEGGYRGNAYLWSNFPLIKTKLTMSVSGDIEAGLAPGFVNSVANDTRNAGGGTRVSFNVTPSPKLILALNGRINYNFISYSISEEQDQTIENHSAGANIKWQFASKFFLESNFNYTLYKNDRFDFNRELPILNGSVRRILGKNNRVELRLAAFDIFNKRVSISQFGSQNFVSRNVAGTLARYYMLSLSYNLRGYENKLNKNNWW